VKSLVLATIGALFGLVYLGVVIEVTSTASLINLRDLDSTALADRAETIEGPWLSYDGVGSTELSFGEGGAVLEFAGESSTMSGAGAIVGDTLSFELVWTSATSGDVTIRFVGSRLKADDVALLDLPPNLNAATSSMVYIGSLYRSDLPEGSSTENVLVKQNEAN
jgi:hypothetical protein